MKVDDVCVGEDVEFFVRPILSNCKAQIEGTLIPMSQSTQRLN